MTRRVAIDASMTGAKRIYMGPGVAHPHTRSAKHHHGEAETAAYCISGRQRVYFGEDFKEFIDIGPGDFVYVPPYIPHIEANEWSEPYTGILCRTPANIVINLEEESHPIEPAGSEH